MPHIPLTEEQAQQINDMRLEAARGEAMRMMLDATVRLALIDAGFHPSDYPTIRLDGNILTAEKQQTPKPLAAAQQTPRMSKGTKE